MVKKYGKTFKKTRYMRPKKDEAPYPADRKLARYNQARSIKNYGIKSEPFPRAMYTLCKFSARVPLTQVLADVSVGNAFRLNSIYDSDLSGSGKTVVAHNILAQIYDQYWVMGARLRVSFNDPSADGCRVGVRLRTNGNNTAIGENVQLLSEAPLTYMDGLNDSGKQVKTFQLYVRPWQLVGVSRLEYMANSSTYSSAISANPAASSTCLADIFLVNPTTSSVTVQANVQIVYYVRLYSRKEFSSSSV